MLANEKQTVLVVGAGVVGLTVANVFVSQGYTVRLLDRDSDALGTREAAACPAATPLPPPFDRPVFPVDRPILSPESHPLGATASSVLDAASMPAFERVSACNARALKLWETLGVALPHETLKATPFYNMRVWDGRTGAHVQFDAARYAVPYLGYIVSHTAIRRYLLARFQKAGGHCIAPCDLRAITTMPTGRVQAVDTTGQEWDADLLVGADGAHSWVRKAVGIAYDRWSYAQHAVVCTFSCQHAHHYTAYQVFTEKGPLALLPLNGGQHVSLVWSVSLSYATTLMAMCATTFAQTVTDAFMHGCTAQGAQPGLAPVVPLQLASERACFPLVMRHAKTYTCPGVVLVGDAAHTLHPLAGQGLNMGLADVVALWRTVHAARGRGRTLADPLYLARYSRQRRAEMWPLIALMEGFKRGYAMPSDQVAQIRAWGMYCVEKSDILKRFCVRYAS